MAFKDLDELLSDEPKRLPVGGKVMEFPGRLNAAQGLMLLRLSRSARDAKAEDADKIAQAVGTEEQWADLERAVLGKPSEDFLEDGLTQVKVQHIFQTLMAWHLHGQEVAEQVWDPPAPANRAAKRSAGKDRRTSTASPASSTPKKTTRPKASAGTSSSSTGASSKRTSRTRASTSKTTT